MLKTNNEIIQNYYEDYNFPSVEKLYSLLKKNDIHIKKKEIINYLSNQKEHEMLKVKKVVKKKQGHITAITYKQNCQMDIYDISKYKNSNKNYKYLLVLIDVFTRKVFARPLKNKDIDDVLYNLTDIFKEYLPSSITSDTDSTFMSKQIQDLLEKNNIFHDVVIASNDHRVLGIIDRYALNVKTTLTKLFLRNNNTIWIDNIEKVINNYNNTPHSSLEDLTPNEATHPIYQADIAIINKNKSTNTKIKSDFVNGDNVRIRLNKTFRKGTEPRYTDKIYIVTSVNGKRITLDNDKTYIESDLIKTILQNTTEEPTNIINKVNKENSTQRKIKKAGVDSNNIIASRTRSKKN